MTPVLLMAVLAMGAEKADVAAPKVDGKWLIVYAEEGGKRNTAWESKQATVEGNTLSYKDGEKERSMTLSFGADQKVKATVNKDGDAKGGDFNGVYISGQDYLCISLNSAGGEKKGDAEPAAAGDKGKETSSGSFILILRRQQK